MYHFFNAIAGYSVSQTLWTLVIAWILWKVFAHVRTVLFSPMAGLPGPKLPLWIPILPDLKLTMSGMVYKYLLDLHETYGNVVRTGPNRVIIGGIEEARDVLKNLDFPKSQVYGFLKGAGQPDNMFITAEKNLHRKLRRLVSPAFSTTYIASLEPYMMQVVHSLVKKVDEAAQAESRNQVDLMQLVGNLAMDVVGETIYGQSFGMIESGRHPFIAARKRIMELLPLRALLSVFLGWVMPEKRLYDHALALITDIAEHGKVYDKFTVDVVQNRQKEIEAAGGNLDSGARKDVLNILITHTDEKYADKLEIGNVISEVNFLLTAGSDTTGLSLTWTFYYLMTHPKCFARLREELDSAFPDARLRSAADQPFAFGFDELPDEKLKKLPYLDAVIKEAMRIMPASALGPIRECDAPYRVPGTDCVIPPGTDVSVSLFALHRSPRLWKYADKYMPERWLEGAEETEPSKVGEPPFCNQAAFLPFSWGSRNCIAQPFAYLEVRSGPEKVARGTLVLNDSDLVVPNRFLRCGSSLPTLSHTMISSSLKAKKTLQKKQRLT